MQTIRRTWLKIAIWALVLGVLGSLIADWGEWDRIGIGIVWRIVIAAIGGIGGVALNYFAGNYVSMGTNVVESMGIVKFSDDTRQKIENTFIFVGALVGALIGMIFVR